MPDLQIIAKYNKSFSLTCNPETQVNKKLIILLSIIVAILSFQINNKSTLCNLNTFMLSGSLRLTTPYFNVCEWWCPQHPTSYCHAIVIKIIFLGKTELSIKRWCCIVTYVWQHNTANITDIHITFIHVFPCNLVPFLAISELIHFYFCPSRVQTLFHVYWKHIGQYHDEYYLFTSVLCLPC